MRVNGRKWSALIGIYTASLLALIQFQNCAPQDLTVNDEKTAPSSEVRVVDDWNARKVNLLSSTITVPPQLTVAEIGGLCDRHMDSSMPLTWELNVPGEGRLVRAGTVECQLGGFKVQISSVQDLICNKTYSFEVRTVDGSFAQGVFIRSCAPN